MIVQFLAYLFLIGVTGFFAIHAMQRVSDPVDRAAWLLLIVPLTVFGSAFYCFTKYRKFRQIGKGGLILGSSKKTLRECLALTDAERA